MIPIALDVPAVAHGPAHPSDGFRWAAGLVRGDGLLAIHGVVMVVVRAGQDRGREATLCAPVVREPGRSPVRARARVHIRHIRDRAVAGLGRGLSAGGGEATVETISGIAGPGRRGLRNFLALLPFLFAVPSCSVLAVYHLTWLPVMQM